MTEGERFFLEGPPARSLLRLSRERGGFLNEEDLLHYRVERRKPISFNFKNARIHTPPAPALGGLLLAMQMKLLRQTPLREEDFGQPQHLETLLGVMALAGNLRNTLHQEGGCITPEGAFARLDASLLEQFQVIYRTHFSSQQGTTQISTIDSSGNACSLTASNGAGCGLILPEGGFMLNNMLGEEDLNPGGFHSWLPNQRLASMMTPTLMEEPGGTLFLTGSGGSNRIRSIILQVILNKLVFSMPVREAVQAPRIHFENGIVSIEEGYAEETLAYLSERYGPLDRHSRENLFFGGAHSVARQQDKELSGFADERRGGSCLKV